MSTLSGGQRRYLRGLAHELDPVVHVGKQGLTPEVLEELDLALSSHELIKVRFLVPEDKKEQARRMEEELEAHLAGLIGHVGIFYRAHPEPEERRIRLPG